MKKDCLFSLRVLFFWSGWLLTLGLVVAIWPRLSHRLWVQFPSYQRIDFERALAEKKQQFALPWKDSRPLTIVAGDSHVELGNWYALFGGSVSVRNCGLSGAKIEDVIEMISAIGDREPKNVLLMCGVNNLGHENAVAFCVTNYERLILTVRSRLNPGRIIVLSVMPLRESAVDRSNLFLNRRISEFNRELEIICARNRVQFVDVAKIMMAAGGGLSPELTIDGLHLNSLGYRKLADALTVILSKPD